MIVQISAVTFEGGTDVFGLGDDNKVYYWDVKDGVWKLDSLKPVVPTE